MRDFFNKIPKIVDSGVVGPCIAPQWCGAQRAAGRGHGGRCKRGVGDAAPYGYTIGGVQWGGGLWSARPTDASVAGEGGPMWASAPTKWGVGADDPCEGVVLSV